jgi:hypothetical protein
MGKLPSRGQTVCSRIIWFSELKLFLDIENDKKFVIFYMKDVEECVS